jgi:hypothetical protein
MTELDFGGDSALATCRDIVLMLLWVLEYLALPSHHNGRACDPAGHVSFSNEILTYGTIPQ